jgi:ABC-type branched-subunit amino acid transport system substrate-binding protein
MSGRSSRPHLGMLLAAVVLFAITACASPAHPPSTSSPVTAGDIRIGAVFPLDGNAAGLATEELAGVQAAADFVNSGGGIGGRRIVLDVRDLESSSDAAAVMATLKADGANVVVGAYASALSIPASQAASDAGLVYWEAGAVADRLTGRGLPSSFALAQAVRTSARTRQRSPRPSSRHGSPRRPPSCGSRSSRPMTTMPGRSRTPRQPPRAGQGQRSSPEQPTT